MIAILLLSILLDEASVFEIEEERDLEIILGEIEFLKQNPVDINTAGFEELAGIPYLSITDCLRIVEYREKYGYYGSTVELLNIPGFDISLFDKIKPFVTVRGKPFRIKRFTTRQRARTEIPKGSGSLEYYTRSQCYIEEYNLYFVSEKDPYEESVLDYYASGLLINESTRTFALGKYNLDIGTGVVLSPLGSFFNSIDFRMITKERGILPYTSVLENNGFFGAALSDSLFLNYTLFYSNQKLDGRIDSLGFARSIDESGEHTDSISISRKDRITEKIFGFDVRYKSKDLLVSNRTYWCFYDPKFACSDSFSRFYGDRFWISAIGLKYSGDFFILFSEVARSFENRIGGLFGFSGYLPSFDFDLAGKYFPVGFYSPKGVEAQNNYIGGVVSISSHSKIVNVRTTLTIDTKNDEDSAKYGLKLNIEKAFGFLNVKFQTRWRYTAETIDLSGSRVFLRIKLARSLFLDLRLEEKYVYKPDTMEKGIFGAVEVGTEYERIRLRIRYGLFDTGSYASRIFVYESDLPGVINNRMLYYKGNYGFVCLSVKPIDSVKLSCKYSIVNRDTLTMKRFGAQLDVRL